MAVPEISGRKRQHIRSIGHYFLSGAEREEEKTRRATYRTVMICGSPGSPWLLPFAVNLALAASMEGEGTILAMPRGKVPIAARLLGASPLKLGIDLRRDDHEVVLQPQANLYLVPIPLLSLVSEHPGQQWLFQFDYTRRGRGVWLYLEEGKSGAAYRDPRLHKGDPLYILGRDHQPAPRRGAGGIWGRLPANLLINPTRPAWPALLSGPEQTRRQYAGYLQALRRVCPVSEEAGAGPISNMARMTRG
ncbi:MAG: hypothetical protein GY835_17680 [bacterium]|nr:hypothetical protein [bacterium]